MAQPIHTGRRWWQVCRYDAKIVSAAEDEERQANHPSGSKEDALVSVDQGVQAVGVATKKTGRQRTSTYERASLSRTQPSESRNMERISVSSGTRQNVAFK
eukprot:4050326-Pleurochrysis_carterae.AAC.1